MNIGLPDADFPGFTRPSNLSNTALLPLRRSPSTIKFEISLPVDHLFPFAAAASTPCHKLMFSSLVDVSASGIAVKSKYRLLEIADEQILATGRVVCRQLGPTNTCVKSTIAHEELVWNEKYIYAKSKLFKTHSLFCLTNV